MRPEDCPTRDQIVEGKMAALRPVAKRLAADAYELWEGKMAATGVNRGVACTQYVDCPPVLLPVDKVKSLFSEARRLIHERLAGEGWRSPHVEAQPDVLTGRFIVTVTRPK